MIRAPQIDRRTANDIVRQLHGLLEIYVPKWRGAGVPGDFGEALVQIFARYAEIVIERLNRAPKKNLLAYLDMLGGALQPPQPARVPLAFSLAAGSTADAVVPARTQAIASPAEDETAPVVFETERELVVVAAMLDKVFARDPRDDSFSDFSPSARAAEERRVFRVTARLDHSLYTRLDHSLYIGLDDLLSRGDLRELRLEFDIDCSGSPPDPREVRWSTVDGANEQLIEPVEDGTAGLAKSGQITFSDLPVIPQQTIAELQSRWLRGRLATPITPTQRSQGVRAAHLPFVRGLTVSARIGRKDVPLDLAFANSAPLDTTKDFLPFGERPRLGDALYLSSSRAFATAGARVTLDVELSAGTAPHKAGNSALTWEYWDGERWAAVSGFSDKTELLTKSGKVAFTLGENPAMLAVSGTEGHWIRVRIAAGHYGEDAKYEAVDVKDPSKGYKYEAPTLAPPSIAKITVEYTLELKDERPDRISFCNDFDHEWIDGGGRPFRRTADAVPTLYFGFDLPVNRRDFPNRPVGLFFGIDEPSVDARPDKRSAAEPPRLVWECWTAENGWQRTGLRDGTRGLTHSGVIEFLAPAGFARHSEFGVERYWLRCRWEGGYFAFEPCLRQVVLNAVMAEHASTVLDEILGSSDGSQRQRFATVHRPILDDGEKLWVREPDLPAAHERNALRAEGEGDDAIAVTWDGAGDLTEIWVRWQEVPDFYGSGPRDRHYVLDHTGGTLSFGDGVNGLIPAPGAANVRLRYRTGGGSAGNRDAHTIVQLTTTIPYIAAVTNPEPARGGADAETIDALLERAPRAIRHGDRAVTIEDFEDLAMLATPEVARAKCVPLYDLSAGRGAVNKNPGTVSVIIVPRSADAKPLPSLVLRERVAAYLETRCLPAVALKVVGPDYRRVDVRAEVVLAAVDLASEVRARIVEALRRFLHPLTGGFDGAGWDFGRSPQKSDLLQVIGRIAGVDHVRSVELAETSDRRRATSLIYVGALDISVAAAAS